MGSDSGNHFTGNIQLFGTCCFTLLGFGKFAVPLTLNVDEKICTLATQRRNRKEFMPRHFWFNGLHQHHFLYSCIGTKSLENMKTYMVYRGLCALYWTCGWSYG